MKYLQYALLAGLALFLLIGAMYAWTFAFFSLNQRVETCVANRASLAEIELNCWGEEISVSSLEDVPRGFVDDHFLSVFATEGAKIHKVKLTILGDAWIHVIIGPDGENLYYVPSYQ